MQLSWIGVLVAFAALAGCATAQDMGRGPMSHEELMRHCQMMQEHHGDGTAAHADHDPAEHGGMSHEEMIRHCAEMRAGEGAPQH